MQDVMVFLLGIVVGVTACQTGYYLGQAKAYREATEALRRARLEIWRRAGC